MSKHKKPSAETQAKGRLARNALSKSRGLMRDKIMDLGARREDQYGLRKGFTYKGVDHRWRWTEPGTFLMGAPEDEPERSPCSRVECERWS